jgi:hypothetical protein
MRIWDPYFSSVISNPVILVISMLTAGMVTNDDDSGKTMTILAVLRIRIRIRIWIHKIHMFLGLPDQDPSLFMQK